MDTEEEDYIQKFETAGYCMPKDVKNLREITEEELKQDIGVTKRGDFNYQHLASYLVNLSSPPKFSSQTKTNASYKYAEGQI